MEKNSTIIEDHEFNEIEKGLFCAINPFDVNIDDWTYDKRHMGFQAITKGFDSDQIATIVYLSTTGSAAMKLISLYNEMKKNGEEVGYIEGLPENNAMGEVYA